MPTLGEYGEDWIALRRVQGRPLAPSTARGYRSVLRRYLLAHFGDVELDRITARQVREWHAALSAPTGPGPSVAPKAYQLLAAITATAVADGLLTSTPCRVRGGGQYDSPPRPTVSVADVLRLADAVPDRYRALVLTAAWAGLRFGELAALRRTSVDLDAAQVRVVSSRGLGPDGTRVDRLPKTRAGRRTVALPAVLLPALRRHLDVYAEPGADGRVFVSPRGASLDGGTFGKAWQRAVAATGLDGVHFHDLRHVAGTLAAQTGATVPEIMARLGHATPYASLRYLHATSDRDAHVAAAVSASVAAAIAARRARGR